VLHAFGAIADRVHERTSHPNTTCTQAESFENIRSPAKAAIDEDFHIVEDFWAFSVKLQQYEDGRRGAVEGSAAVIADQDALTAHLHCNPSICS
jgi:hypothetical protein